MASLGGQREISTINQAAENKSKRSESREGSAERKVSKDRDEKLRYARERQNEERQRKIEELKAQAEAAQRYREQKEEERRRRIEEIRLRDSEKRNLVEERKKAIIEAEKERREYILKKNQERDSRIEVKRRDRNSMGFAFGSSTPRLLEPADFGTVSPSTFWGQRRSTSISNVAGASLSRRSSERELADSGAKKRATSASGTDRHDDHRRKSSSMYEVFNWGYSNDEPPKRFSLSIVGSEINIDGPPTTTTTTTSANNTNNNYNNFYQTSISAHRPTYYNNNNSIRKEDNVDTTPIIFRSVARRKTDLMPTIPSPRDGHYGSRSSLSTTPRTPGRAFSMNRLDQLAQPIRRNGEHIRAILERERRERELEMLDETASLGDGRRVGTGRPKRAASAGASGSSSAAGIMSRSMTHLAAGGGNRGKYSLGGGISSNFRPLGNGNRDSCSRSGNVTPGGHISTSRPGSAMSTSTTMSNSGFVPRRPVPAQRKQRPASIAGTGVSLEEINKLKKDHNRPPIKTTTGTSSNMSSAQTTPKRTSNLMSTSMIVTSSSTRLSSAEKKTPKREPPAPKSASASKAITKTASSERLNKLSKDPKPKEVASLMAKSMIVTNSNNSNGNSNQLIDISVAENHTKAVAAASGESQSTSLDMAEKGNAMESFTSLPAQSKEEKDAFNSIKTEEEFLPSIEPQKDATGTGATENIHNVVVANEEKLDLGNEKLDNEPELVMKPRSKENSVVRELTPPTQSAVDGSNDLMTASMIARKITTEEEAKAALAERRRLAREEAERQAELEKQRLEAERLAEIKRQEEEAERQRQFEEEATRMAEEQRRAEEERLRKAIEEAQQREDEERRKREEEERQRLEREEAEKKAKEEAEKQRIEVAERLKREEKEREERRKRVEAIMSRTRKGNPAGAPAGGAATPNLTPAKASNNDVTNAEANQSEIINSEGGGIGSNISTSTSGSSSTSTAPTTPTPIPAMQADIATTIPNEPLNSQAMYEQSVIDKENSLINSFSNMIIDENAKYLHQQIEVSNGKLHAANYSNSDNINNTTSVANGNGHSHIENVNNKNDINILQDVVAPATNQLIDLSIESQDLNNPLNFNNNNSLLTTTTTTLVTADSHENKDISLL